MSTPRYAIRPKQTFFDGRCQRAFALIGETACPQLTDLR